MHPLSALSTPDILHVNPDPALKTNQSQEAQQQAWGGGRGGGSGLLPWRGLWPEPNSHGPVSPALPKVLESDILSETSKRLFGPSAKKYKREKMLVTIGNSLTTGLNEEQKINFY